MPDYTKKSGRKKIKRKNRDDLEKAIVDYYISQESVDKTEVLTVE